MIKIKIPGFQESNLTFYFFEAKNINKRLSIYLNILFKVCLQFIRNASLLNYFVKKILKIMTWFVINANRVFSPKKYCRPIFILFMNTLLVKLTFI